MEVRYTAWSRTEFSHTLLEQREEDHHFNETKSRLEKPPYMGINVSAHTHGYKGKKWEIRN